MNDHELAISELLTKKNYPCVAAVKSYATKDFEVHTYEDFGKKYQRPELRLDLLQYLKKFNQSKSTYFTFWAIFKNQITDLNENDFEKLLWNELSSLTSLEAKPFDADPGFSSDPDEKKFCFSLAGKALFVVGLHPHSSRKSRQFPWPTLIFNPFEQFDQLAAKGLYHPMIEQNRKRDTLFQGSANPMALKYNDDWESIQFSGKNNASDWKCPFHFRSAEKTLNLCND